MIRYQCPVCHSEDNVNVTPAMDLSKGLRRVCLQCGADLALLLLVTTKAKLIGYIERRLNK